MQPELISQFARSCELAEIHQTDRARAQAAIQALYDFVVPRMHQAKILTPFYAEHGIDHVDHLAILFNKLLEKLKSMSSPGFLKSADFLVILYSAFVLHDVGMSLLFADGADQQRIESGLPQLWQDRWVRTEHDERSLRYIEEELCPSNDLAAWYHYWQHHDGHDFPKPQGRWALLIAARICQSHGDSQGWLEQNLLWRYEPLTDAGRKLFGGRVDFQNDWPLNQNVLTWLEAGSALLCLCDLCEIGSHRFRAFDEPLTKMLVPSGDKERLNAFLHWYGHHFATVSFESSSGTHPDGSIAPVCYAKNPSGGELLRLLLLTHGGPVRDLLRWGSHATLQQALKNVGLRIDIPQIKLGAVDGTASDLAEVEAAKEAYRPLWVFEELNKAVCKDADRYTSLYQHLLGGAFSADNPGGICIPFFRELIDTANAGLRIECCYTLTSRRPTLKDHAVAVILPGGSVNCTSQLSDLDSFAAAIQICQFVVKQSIESQKKNLASIPLIQLRLAYLGNPLHEELTRGEIGNCRRQIVFIHVSRPEKYDKLLRAVADDNRDDTPHFIFFGDPRKVGEIDEQSVLSSHLTVANEKLKNYISAWNSLSKVVAGLFVQTLSVELPISPPDLDRIQSPVELLREIFVRRTGEHSLFRQISGWLDLNHSSTSSQAIQSSSAAMSEVLLMLLYEFMRLSDSRGVDQKDLKRRYESLKILFPENEVEEGEATTAWLNLNHFLSTRNGALFPRESTTDPIAGALARLVRESRKAMLAQLVILYRMILEDGLFNVNSTLLHDHPRIALDVLDDQTLKKLCKSISLKAGLGDKDEFALDEAVCLAIGTAKLFTSVEAGIERSYRFLKELGRLCSDDLVESYEMVSFQAAYALFSTLYGPNDYDEFFKVERVKDISAVVRLGYLEAVASYEGQRTELQRAAETKAWITFAEDLVSSDAINKRPFLFIMAFDILVKYGVSRGAVLGPAKVKLMSDAAPRQLDRICEFVHFGSETDDVPSISEPNRRSTLLNYVRLRDSFLKVRDLYPRRVFSGKLSAAMLKGASINCGLYSNEKLALWILMPIGEHHFTRSMINYHDRSFSDLST